MRRLRRRLKRRGSKQRCVRQRLCIKWNGYREDIQSRMAPSATRCVPARPLAGLVLGYHQRPYSSQA